MTTNRGSYRMDGFVPGTYTTVPSNPSYLFIPASQQVTVGPDQLSINFHAYRWSALSLDSVTNGLLHLVLAWTNGVTWRVFASTNFQDWSPSATNQVGVNQTAQFDVPATGPASQVYRAVTP